MSAEEEHPLCSSFSFWYLQKGGGAIARRGLGAAQVAAYTENIKQLASVTTVEEFWATYSHLTRPNDLPAVDYHLFRTGIAPLWEDVANKNGGKWVVRLKKGMANRCWENAILAMIGDSFNLGDELCGVVISIKYQEDIISFWNKTANDSAITTRLRDGIKKALGLNNNNSLEYRPHDQAIKNNHAFENLAERDTSGGGFGMDSRDRRHGGGGRNRPNQPYLSRSRSSSEKGGGDGRPVGEGNGN